MIPGTTMLMSELMKQHADSFGYVVYSETMNSSAVLSDFKNLRIPVNATLEEIDKTFGVSSKMIVEFERGANFGERLTHLISARRNIQEKYEAPIRTGFRIDEEELTSPDRRWDPDYVAFHCVRERSDLPLSELGYTFLEYIAPCEFSKEVEAEQYLKLLAEGAGTAIYARYLDAKIKEQINAEIKEQNTGIKENAVSEYLVQEDTINENLTLQEIFASADEYALVISLLKEWDLMDETETWRLGKGKKMKLVCLVRVLDRKGYFKETYNAADYGLIISVIKNSFNISIAPRTVRDDVSRYNREFAFIPDSSLKTKM
ncbi:hypothetical protein [Taibaiella soli]|uniref:Uncharacterized protein n=1 Tax=Taibaiella soli TaxID=1649169 RepID=A0A2W2AY13_9BACT|nr:hypothetical protein [Taibaiella soli]PZF72578.1 hypothetical protein DN068_11985 [Taibaiella soli]